MINIFVWGTGKNAYNCLEFFNLKKINILAFVESIPQKLQYLDKSVISPEQVIEQKYDYLIVASTFEKEITSIINQIGIKKEKVLFWNRQDDRDKLFVYLPLSQKGIKLEMYRTSKSFMPYQVCNVDQSYYIYNCKDRCISTYMVEQNETFSKQEIDVLFEIINDTESGYFFDIGGNIGTTSIYIKRNINENLKIIAFEPVKENYNMFRINNILNHCEDVIVENVGISNEDSIATVKICESNFGGSAIVSSQKGEEFQQIRCITLDSYVKEKKINIKKIKYIWVDIEGHEAFAIEGAKDTLARTDACLYMEYNVAYYIRQNKYRLLLDNLKQIYKQFICIEQYIMGNKKKRDIEEIDFLDDEMQHKQCNVLFMK